MSEHDLDALRNLDALRRASESLLPAMDNLSDDEVRQMLQAAGSDPAALAARAAALAAIRGNLETPRAERASVADNRSPPSSDQRERPSKKWRATAPLRGCGDFQALLPDYRAQRLSAERQALLQDHLHSCVACRRALHAPAKDPVEATWRRHEQSGRPLPTIEARPQATNGSDQAKSGQPHAVATALAAPPSIRRRWLWTYAAAAALAVVAGFWAGRAGLLPGQSRVLATVTSPGGGVYAVGEASVRPVEVGYRLLAGGELRTGRRAGADVRLHDGSQLELGPGADLTVTRGWSGTTVHLLRGQIIVRAAHQGWSRHLYVATADSLAAVRGTIFSMSSGLLGSRLAVVEGSVAFDYTRDGRGLREMVGAGQEASSSSRLSPVPFSEELGWSQEAGQYIAMLGELSAMGKQLEAITPPPVRYQSALVNDVPAAAAVYAAIPNLGDTLSQADQILQDNLAQSPVLSAWLNQPANGTPGAATRGAMVEDALHHIQQINQYLGSEIVAALVPKQPDGLVVMALAKPGLEDVLTTPQGDGQPQPTRILANPADAGAGPSSRLLIWLGTGSAGPMMVASRNGTVLQQTVALAQQATPGPFLQTGLYQQIAPVYEAGASWLLAADLNLLRLQNVLNPVLGSTTPSKPEYLVAQSKPFNGAHATDVRMTFSGPRQGAAALLGAPGPMGGLAFISTDATLAASVLTESPATLLAGMSGAPVEATWRRHEQSGRPLPTIEARPQATNGSDQAKSGEPQGGNPSPESQQFTADLANLAAPLGGEFTVAQDGPILPHPSWRLVAEVNDSVAMQNAIAQLVTDLGPHQGAGHSLTLTLQALAGQPYYLVSRDGAVALAYTYAGTYLVAGPTLAAVQAALQTYNSGAGLPTSSAFQQQLPVDGRSSFSAILYHDFNQSLAPLAQQLGAAAPPQLQPALAALFANSTPGLAYAYGQPNQIELASSQGLLGMTIEDLLALRLQSVHGEPHP